MPEIQPPTPEIVAFLATLQIDDLSPTDPFHLRLVDACHRTAGQSVGARLVALEWVFSWDLRRYIDDYGLWKTTYDNERAKSIIRHRDAGEKSGAMAEFRADAEDEIRELHLKYRLAEQMMRLANKRVATINHQFEAWRSENANVRAADLHHARTGT